MKKVLIFLAAVFIFSSFSGPAFAAELVVDEVVTVKARVLDVVKEEAITVAGTDVPATLQTLRVEILEGKEKGREVEFQNDYIRLQEGEVFYLRHTANAYEEIDYYSVADPYRLPALIFLTGLFILLVIIFGGWRGVRGLLALLASFFFIIFLLFPGILRGYSPILVSVGVSSLIIVLGSYLTHGWNRTTTSAVLGMIVSILFSGGIAYAAVRGAHLTGIFSDESVYLHLNTNGAIDFVGLLLGAILIGLLGVLYDAAIGQAIAVEELSRAGPHLPRSFIAKRALRMGREHIGALVNTLAIAYVGVSLPLLLLFFSFASGETFFVTINREIFAAEIVRMLVGSIGLVLAVPITTLVSSYMLVRSVGGGDVNGEREAVEKISG